MPVTTDVSNSEAKRITQLQDKIIKDSWIMYSGVGRAYITTDTPISMIETIIVLKPKKVTWRRDDP